jgi:3-hydroxyisobutyrate dehydrogenase-like beta-hydroxyacid dehydrogenase
VCLGRDGILARIAPGATIVDLSTAPVSLARRLYAEFEARGCAFADAPVARTRQAAIDGTLSIMVGATPPTFARLEPLLRHMASEVTHCGEAGAGQAVKILNNMILFQTGVALAEGLSIARAHGVDGKVLFETLTKGSADSFALRNHGMKAMLPGVFPERAFSTVYALKDLSYAIEMAKERGVPALGADVARELMERAKELGYDKEYWPVLIKAIEDEMAKG